MINFKCVAKNVSVIQEIPKIPTAPIRPDLNTEPESNLSLGTRQTTIMIAPVASIMICNKVGTEIGFPPGPIFGNKSG